MVRRAAPAAQPAKPLEAALANVDPTKTRDDTVYTIPFTGGGAGTVRWAVTVTQQQVDSGMKICDVLDNPEPWRMTREQREAHELIQAELAVQDYTIRYAGRGYRRTDPLADLIAAGAATKGFIDIQRPTESPVKRVIHTAKRAGDTVRRREPEKRGGAKPVQIGGTRRPG
ncbi:MAG: hypothetical protein V1735_06930 [Nanoarchaeota archaeon]